MKDKIYVLGPKSSGKTTFIHKLMGRDFVTFKDKVIESGEKIKPDDAAQIYLIFPNPDELRRRGGEITDEEVEEWMTFYYPNAKDITIVEDF